MMRKLIIATHGTFAEGIRSSLSVLTGGTERIDVINAFIEGGENNPKEAMLNIINNTPAEQEILILTDLYGGSVNNIATLLINESGRNNLHVVAGINLALVAELLLNMDDVLTPQTIHEVIEQAKGGIKYMNEEFAEALASTPAGVEEDFFKG